MRQVDGERGTLTENALEHLTAVGLLRKPNTPNKAQAVHLTLVPSS